MKVVLTCGGTAGHINPAIAVAGRLKELIPDCDILFIGANGHMETELVPREGYNICTLTVTNISRGHDVEALRHNIETIKNVAVSIREAKKILREFKPDVVVGTGGYVCYPVIIAAEDLGIPCAVHESNAVPGLTTKMLADRVERIMVGFPDSAEHYRHPDRVEVTGTPVRGQFDNYSKEQAKTELGLDAEKPLIVSVWGSLGAGRMNDVVTELLCSDKMDGSFNIIHSVGKRYYKEFTSKLNEKTSGKTIPGADVREYIYDMPKVMAAADLIMCRAGASTLAELCYMGKPAVIVPSPNVTKNHQEHNARVLENAGGAKVYLENELDCEAFFEDVCSLVKDDAALKKMSESMKALAVENAVDRICEIVLELANKN